MTILVSGITFIKNGLSLGYPIKESIESIEPMCDEIIINVGFEDPECTKDDGTWAYLNEHFKHQKFRFLKSYWDPAKTKAGLILSEQTNIALKEAKGEFIHYIQGDEVIHQDDYSIIHDGIIQMKEDSRIEGLVFDYIHFYGNLDVVKHTRNTYRREVRVIRNKIGLVSHLDAQGFRHHDGKKPNCIRITARIFHYGWARPKSIMAKKIKVMDRFYHGENYNRHQKEDFEYRRIWGLKPFLGTHPRVVLSWVEKNKSDLDVFSLKLHFGFKDLGLVVSDAIEYLTNYRLGEFKNYRLL
jgi:hypothetical protein